eukprot:scaffold125312_cov69-Phaeocystis_antarctica.AAC.2
MGGRRAAVRWRTVRKHAKRAQLTPLLSCRPVASAAPPPHLRQGPRASQARPWARRRAARRSNARPRAARAACCTWS